MSDMFYIGQKTTVLMLFRQFILVIAFLSFPFQSAFCLTALQQVWQHDDSKRVINHPNWVRNFDRQSSEENNAMKQLAVHMQSPNASATIYIQAGEERDTIFPGSYEFSQSYSDQDGHLKKEVRAVYILKFSENTIDQLKENLSAIQEKYAGKSFMVNIFQCKACGKCDGDGERIRGVVDEVFQSENFLNVVMHKKSILPNQEDMNNISLSKTEQEDISRAHKIGYIVTGACMMSIPVASFFLWKAWKEKSQKQKVM